MRTPAAGIRLLDGAPIPPAPSLGRHSRVPDAGARKGAVIETTPGRWIAVCGECRTPLAPRTTRDLAAGALGGHWDNEHPGDAA